MVHTAVALAFIVMLADASSVDSSYCLNGTTCRPGTWVKNVQFRPNGTGMYDIDLDCYEPGSAGKDGTICVANALLMEKHVSTSCSMEPMRGFGFKDFDEQGSVLEGYCNHRKPSRELNKEPCADIYTAVCGIKIQSEGSNLRSIQPECCRVPNPATLCKPSDRYEVIGTCENIPSKPCSYKKSIGVSLERSAVAAFYASIYGGSFSDNSRKLLNESGVLLHELKQNFLKNLNFSNATGYQWRSDDTYWQPETSSNTPDTVKPGVQVQFVQVVGTCGFMKVRTDHVRRTETGLPVPLEKPNVLRVVVIVGVSAGIVLAISGVVLFVWLLQRARKAEGLLSDAEVQEFLQGKKQADVPQSYLKLEEANGNEQRNGGFFEMVSLPDSMELDLDVDCLPYNYDFELPKKKFVIDTKTELGSGAYGVVYAGFIRKNRRDPSPRPVAIKTVRRSAGKEHFKALMYELKILAYMRASPSEKVVGLIGAYSKNVKNGELYMALELCEMSLLHFLQTRKTQAQAPGQLTRWAAEIAAGMEFVGSKRVVHADLAARNVLLTFDGMVKVSDFGLARQLINYEYLKSDQGCLLPWKWMAVESLAVGRFSRESDAWAYGVTLWELFTLGDVPFSGMAWTPDFGRWLENGLRLPKPEHADDDIFNVMMECWAVEPSERPKFGGMKQFFETRLGMQGD